MEIIIPLSELDKMEIAKMEAIVKLLDGVCVRSAKSIIAKIQNHLDSCSLMSEEMYLLNIKPIFEKFNVVSNIKS